MSAAVPQISVGDKFEQITVLRDGTRLKRVIEITGRPTPSSPVNYRVRQNDAHPHRKGKHGSIRRSELLRKYHPA